MMNLTVIEHNKERVLTTKQLEEVGFGSAENIKRNFNRNKERFIEGKHYFVLQGEELNILRGTVSPIQISPKTRTLYLWTEKGIIRHAKILDTDMAWDIQERLEETYFAVKEGKLTPQLTMEEQLALQVFHGGMEAVEATKVLVEMKTKPLIEANQKLEKENNKLNRKFEAIGDMCFEDISKLIKEEYVIPNKAGKQGDYKTLTKKLKEANILRNGFDKWDSAKLHKYSLRPFANTKYEKFFIEKVKQPYSTGKCIVVAHQTWIRKEYINEFIEQLLKDGFIVPKTTDLAI